MSVIAHKTKLSFAEFYAGYLAAHSLRASRQLHFFGSSCTLAFLVALALSGNIWWLLAAVMSFCVFAAIRHYRFERNLPYSFRHPLYSFVSAWLMYCQLLTGQILF